jgi:hypothetical protein
MNKALAGALPISTVAKIGQIGPYHADVNSNNADGTARGPFEIKPCANPSAATYPVLWAIDAELHTMMAFEADSEGIEKVGKNSNQKAAIQHKVTELVSTMSNCHFNRDFRFNSQALSMQFTTRPTIGGRSWLSIKLSNEQQEKALVLWANSSLGLLLHWWHGNKSQPGRSTIGKSALDTLPVFDVRSLSAQKMKTVDKVFADLSELSLKPMHEMDKDDVRQRLDEEFLGGVLALPSSLFASHGAMSLLRAKLALEPSVRGQK